MNKKETAALSVSADGRPGVPADAKEKQLTLSIPSEIGKGNRQRKFNVVDGETLMSTPLPPIRFAVSTLLPQGLSWKFRLMNAIDHCMSQSRSRREFIENMKLLEYGVSWSDNRKHITYTCPNGMKCRDNRLHEAKYLKESMQLEFQYRAVERAEPAGIAQAGQAVSTGGLRHSAGTVGIHDELTQEQPAAAGRDNGGDPAGSQRVESEREGLDSTVHTGGFVETGWEQSRQDLEGFERTGGFHSEPAVGNPSLNPAVALNGLSLADNLVGLARNLGEMTEEPARPAKPKAVHERKRAIGQRPDDYEQEQLYELTM